MGNTSDKESDDTGVREINLEQTENNDPSDLSKTKSNSTINPIPGEGHSKSTELDLHEVSKKKAKKKSKKIWNKKIQDTKENGMSENGSAQIDPDENQDDMEGAPLSSTENNTEGLKVPKSDSDHTDGYPEQDESTATNAARQTKSLISHSSDHTEDTTANVPQNEQSDTSVKKKDKKKGLNFFKKKSESSSSKNNDKGKQIDSLDKKSTVKEPSSTDLSEAIAKNMPPIETFASVAKGHQHASEGPSENEATQRNDIINEAIVMSQSQEQSQPFQENECENRNERGTGQTEVNSAHYEQSIVTDINESETKKEKAKRKFRFKKHKVMTDSDSQGSVKSKQSDSDQKDGDSEGSPGCRKSRRGLHTPQKSLERSEAENPVHSDNNKEEEKKKRRKSAKVHPADFYVSSSHNKQIKEDIRNPSGVSLEHPDTSASANCARIISDNTDTDSTEMQQTEIAKEIGKVDSLQLLTLPSPPWTPNKFEDQEYEQGFIDSHGLYNKLSDGMPSPCKNDPSALLILDTRDEVAHNQHHIATAKLAERVAQTDDESWPTLNDYALIVLYDDNGLTLSLTDSVLSQTLEQLESKGLKPLILRGGYKDFYSQYPFLCVQTNKEGEIKPTYCLDYPSEILTDQLYLGTGDQAITQRVIKNLKITHVVNVCTEYTNAFEGKLTYFNIPVKDEPTSDLQSHFLKVILFINDAINGKGRVLIHCVLGASRSAAIVIAYLMMSHKWTASDAAKFVSARRPIIAFNRGFLKQLKSFEKKLYGKNFAGSKMK